MGIQQMTEREQALYRAFGSLLGAIQVHQGKSIEVATQEILGAQGSWLSKLSPYELAVLDSEVSSALSSKLIR